LYTPVPQRSLFQPKKAHLLIDGDRGLPLLLPEAGELCGLLPGLLRPCPRNRLSEVLREVALIPLG